VKSSRRIVSVYSYKGFLKKRLTFFFHDEVRKKCGRVRQEKFLKKGFSKNMRSRTSSDAAERKNADSQGAERHGE